MRLSPAPSRPHPSGFTLIEMLVVLAIVGLIAGLGFPALERASAALSAREARAVVLGAVAGARAEALRTGHAVDLVMLPDRAGLGFDGRTVTLRPGQRTWLAPASIRFYADGSASGGRVVLNAGGRIISFAVDSLTGAATTEGDSNG